LAVLVVLGHRLAQSGAASGASEVVAPLEPVADGSGSGRGASESSDRALVVHVVGAVRRPGLLRLKEGARVADAVARAGGATRRADLAALNLAAPLVDGTQVLVPLRAATGLGGSTGPVGAAAESASAAGAPAAGAAPKVSLGSATLEELDQLPGVGPVTAQKILDYRAEHGPFRSVEDLDAVPGIGPVRIEQLRDLVTP
ncbi:MAG TPA: ComEA family DNA-binding protein, partial [Gaiellaceae bacterium]|nr:ComEA family DNA-binding protein [Gaiellaceae bacterium]